VAKTIAAARLPWQPATTATLPTPLALADLPLRYQAGDFPWPCRRRSTGSAHASRGDRADPPRPGPFRRGRTGVQRRPRRRAGSRRPRSRGEVGGLSTTAPSGSNREPWQGQSQLRSASLKWTVHPRCVQCGGDAVVAVDGTALPVNAHHGTAACRDVGDAVHMRGVQPVADEVPRHGGLGAQERRRPMRLATLAGLRSPTSPERGVVLAAESGEDPWSTGPGDQCSPVRCCRGGQRNHGVGRRAVPRPVRGVGPFRSAFATNLSQYRTIWLDSSSWSSS
jgi:hypothetical protein